MKAEEQSYVIHWDVSHIHGGHSVEPGRIVLDTELVGRRSCGCGGSPEVAREV